VTATATADVEVGRPEAAAAAAAAVAPGTYTLLVDSSDGSASSDMTCAPPREEGALPLAPGARAT